MTLTEAIELLLSLGVPFTLGRAASADVPLERPYFVIIGHREVALGGANLADTLLVAIAEYTLSHGH
jgi:hypothetical protein